jgi:hypothetical protein
MRYSRSAAILVGLSSVCALGAGFVHNENFVVFTEATISPKATEEFAQSVLAKAEEYRKQISIEWFGEELPPGIGRTTINVRFSPDRDSGLTWAVDHPDRKLHTVYLFARPDESVGSTLAHEMAHVVLATQCPHPHRLPAWVEEGIASQYDNSARRQTRGNVLRFFASREDWPQVSGVVSSSNIPSEDTRSYAVAVSLTEMLLESGGKQTFLEFGRMAGRDGFQPAIARYYQVRDMAELQIRWQKWVSRSASASPQLSRLTAPIHRGQ